MVTRFSGVLPRVCECSLALPFILSLSSSIFPLGKNGRFGIRVSEILLQFLKQTVGGVENPCLCQLWFLEVPRQTCEKSDVMGEGRETDWNQKIWVSTPP